MISMNRWDVEDAAELLQGDPVLGPASATLLSLMRWTDRNSDGWLYWRKPGNASRSLQALIPSRYEYGNYDYEAPSAAEVRKAYGPIKAMATRARTKNGITDTFDIYLPVEENVR